MKKLSYVVAFLICGQLMNAQSKKVDSFDSIEISGSISAELIQSDEERVEFKITKGDAKDLIIKNRESSLIVKTKGKWLDGKATSAKVIIYYKSIDDLEVGSGSSVNVKDRIKVVKFDLEVSSGSTCSMALITDMLDIEVSSGSTLSLDGQATKADIEVSSGSSFRASDLVVKDVEIEVSSGSTAQIEVLDSLMGEVSSGSTLRYSGNPAKVDMEKDISSSVSRR